MNITSDKPIWNSKQGTTSSVSLTVTDGTPISCGESAIFYIGFIPHISTKLSVTVTALTADNKSVKHYVSNEYADGIKFNEGMFKVMRINLDDCHPIPINYVRVNETLSDWSGTYLFVNESSSKAFAAFSDVSGYAAKVVINDEKIASDGNVDKYAITVTSMGEKHPAISNSPSYDVCNSDGKYIYWSTNKGGLVLDDNNIYEKHPANNNNDTKYGHCIEYSDNGVKVMSAGLKSGFTTYYLLYSDGSFSYSKSSSTIQLYRLDTETRQRQVLSFPSNTVVWKVGSDYELDKTYDVQHVEGAMTPVTYTSNNTDVVVISGNCITIKGYGTATIIASAQGDDEYTAASASYTLTIDKEGVFNLENPSVMDYMNAADLLYTDDNYKTTTIVKNYCDGQSSTNRKDSPAPVTLSWTSSSSGEKIIRIYNDGSMTDLEMTAITTSNTIDIRNLIPGRNYWYNVSTSSDGIIASGKFETEGRRRMILVSDIRAKGHANNCRDIGGLVTTNGKKLKYGIIFRGTNLDMTTDAEKSLIVDYLNVGIDIDVRQPDHESYTSQGEDGNATSNNPWTGDWSKRIIYCNDGSFGGTFNSNFNVGLKEKNAKFSTMFTQLLNTIRTGKAAYIHCHVGADRTGYICLILEMVLGVSPKDCSIDFELTSLSVASNRLRTGDGTHNMCKDALNYISSYRGDTYMEKAYNILTDYGISDAQIQEFRSIMLE